MFRKIHALILSLFISVTYTCFAVSPASALEAGDIVIQVQPASQEIELAPGQTLTASISVTNSGRLPFSFSVISKPYQAANENYDPDFSTENSYTRLHNWITFPEANFQIAPGEKREVPFTITVPDNVPGGGQYAAIIVQTRDSVEEGATVKIVGQLASLIYAHVSGEEHVGGVLLANNVPGFLLGSPLSATATVKNDGNIDFRMNHSLVIRDFFTNREVFNADSVDANGNLIGRTSSVILPESKRTNIITWNGAPQLGIFRAVQTVSFLDQSYTKEQVVVLCPIWLAGGVCFMIFLMIFWISLRVRNRKRRRPQVF